MWFLLPLMGTFLFPILGNFIVFKSAIIFWTAFIWIIFQQKKCEHLPYYIYFDLMMLFVFSLYCGMYMSLSA